MLKKIILQISSVILMLCFAVVMSSCENHNTVEQSVDNNSEYAHLYNTDYIKTGVNSFNLSVEDLKQMHSSIASIYQVRSELQKDWSKRKQYVLNSEIFSNKYLQKEMTMYLYECARFLTPNEEEYVKNLPYIENIIINLDEIFEKDNLLLIPVYVDGRDYWNDIDEQKKERDKNKYEQFFVFERVNKQWLIVNFIEGYLQSKKIEVYPQISKYNKEDWDKSFYNREKI